MFRTLYAKLALALLGLLALMGGLFVLISLWTTQRYIQEVNQKLHIDVADHLVKEVILIENDQVNESGLKHIFHMMMVINPSIEIYLLDPEGKILAFSAPPGKVKVDRISLKAIHRFLSPGGADLPIVGDDPRLPGFKRTFSAARIGDAEHLRGYLYVVLGGERYTSVVELLEGSHILRLSLLGLLGSLLLAGFVGLVAFAMLTGRLQRLRSVMDAFEQSGFREPVSLEGFRSDRRGDELDQLGATFDRLSQEMTRQLERARGADVLRRELVANVSHDLRTPLASLNAFLETLLLKDRELSSANRRRYVEVALRHSRSLAELVSRLFELAKLEARQTLALPEAFAFGELVQDVAQKFELVARQKGIRIDTKIPHDLPFVWADLGLIERVLDNLIDNAIRHTPSGGSVTLALCRDAGRVRLQVYDTGEGIPPEDLPFVFERFYRGKNSEGGGRPDRNSGLGLAIAQHIAELHDSRIEVSSRVGAGTCFELRLSVATHPASTGGARATPRGTPVSRLPR